MQDKYLVLIGCGISTILFVVTTTGEQWIKHNPPPGHLDDNQNKNGSLSNDQDYIVDYYGIWKFCFRNGKCLEIVEAWRFTKWLKIPNWLQAVRIFACTATGIEAFGLLNAISAILKNTKTLRESKYVMVAGPCLMLIAVTIFTGFERPEHENYIWGWTFILGWASVTFSMMYGLVVLYVIMRRKRKLKKESEINIEAPMMP